MADGVSSVFYVCHVLLPLSKNPPQVIYELYNKVGYNCFIAAAVYVLFGFFSCCQMRLNKKKVISFPHLFDFLITELCSKSQPMRVGSLKLHTLMCWTEQMKHL